MSKKIPKQSNTIFNYFQSPKSNKTSLNNSGTSDLEVNEKPLKKMEVDEGSEDEPVVIQNKKRSRIIESDSDNENSESSANRSDLKKFSKKVKTESEGNTNGKDGDPGPSTSSSMKTVKESLKTDPVGDVLWLHDKLDFLKPKNIRDSKKRKKDDPDYDSHTLYVPESYLMSLTPAMRQWWILKSEHYDCVLFFKVGKFYELYHMDAVTGVNCLGFSYMKGEFAHSGFPETAYGKFAQSLTDQGFKVARVEQTETPEMMAERCKKGKNSKLEKVVNREICQITTKGTCIYGPQMSEAKNASLNYMLAIVEKVESEYSIRYGVCFVDTSIGVFHMSEFSDDRHSSKLLAVLSEHPPVLILTERNKMSSITNDILKKYIAGARIEKLSSSSQFYKADKTLQKLQEGSYFKDDNGDFSWPKVLSDLIEDDSCKPGYELALRALGACHWYLKDSLLDIQVFSMKQFKMYQPFQHGELKCDNKYMILDAVTIQNLALFGKAGTLQKSLDLCRTAFGKRLLLDWIYRPLCRIDKITLRQEAVKELVNNPERLRSTRHILKKLPDLERQIMKIHTFGNKQLAEDHPDSRAIFYEAKTYFKRKILDLTSTLKGFESATQIINIFKDCESKLLRKITHCSPDGIFYDLTDSLDYFKSAFDQEEAAKQGKIIPQQGIDADYDNADDVIKGINEELEEYLKEQKEFFKCSVVYFGSDRKRYQLEIPESRCHKVTTEYTLEGTRKGSKPTKRYSTPKTKEFLARMTKAENERSRIIADLNRRVFAKFSERYTEWSHVTSCLATLDVLCSLAEYARTFSHDVCLPEVTSFSDQPFIKIENGRHPCIPKIDDYVPNDTQLGTDDKAGILILTGPNMGGKSTLMRQVSLILVMAQIGSYVPASSCQMSLIDRIFTRLGAEDDIMSGQSTFFVEVSEASAILQHATKHSFVLLDELGRGTSTHDGNAIATAYMKKLLDINCRVIYSTHYHTLVEYYGGRTDIQLGHMACLVENEREEGKETVTFLYKLESGACSNSYGFNVAKLAGLPNNIVDSARGFAKKLEETNNNRLSFTKLFTADLSSLKETIRTIKNLNI